MYYEESILSERMIKKGYTTYFYNDYTVLHNHGETTGKIENQLLIYKYGFNAGIYYYKQYRQLSPFLVTCSKMNFALFQVLHLVKTYIKKAIKKNGKY